MPHLSTLLMLLVSSRTNLTGINTSGQNFLRSGPPAAKSLALMPSRKEVAFMGVIGAMGHIGRMHLLPFMLL